jgi:hypothetical protein
MFTDQILDMLEGYITSETFKLKDSEMVIKTSAVVEEISPSPRDKQLLEIAKNLPYKAEQAGIIFRHCFMMLRAEFYDEEHNYKLQKDVFNALSVPLKNSADEEQLRRYNEAQRICFDAEIAFIKAYGRFILQTQPLRYILQPILDHKRALQTTVYVLSKLTFDSRKKEGNAATGCAVSKIADTIAIVILIAEFGVVNRLGT